MVGNVLTCALLDGERMVYIYIQCTCIQKDLLDSEQKCAKPNQKHT